MSALNSAWDKWKDLNNWVAKWTVPGLLIPFLITVPGVNAIAAPAAGNLMHIAGFWLNSVFNPAAWSAGFDVWGGALSDGFNAVADVVKSSAGSAPTPAPG